MVSSSEWSRWRPLCRHSAAADRAAARLVRDYEGRYGATQGFWTTDQFVEAAFKSLSGSQVTRSN